MKIIAKITIIILCYLFPFFAFAQDTPNNSLDEVDANLKQVKALLYESHDSSQSLEIRLSSALSLNKKADDEIRRSLQEKIDAFKNRDADAVNISTMKIHTETAQRYLTIICNNYSEIADRFANMEKSQEARQIYRQILNTFSPNKFPECLKMVELGLAELKSRSSNKSVEEPLDETQSKETTIINLAGSGLKNTRPFKVNGHWEVQWDARGAYFGILIYNADGSFAGLAANQQGAGKGSSYQPKSGHYYLTINAVGNWQVKVIELK